MINFLFKNNVQFSIHSLKSNFYYSILVNTKFHYPLYESMWENLFGLDNDRNLEKIYSSKIKQMYAYNIAEFNYKLLYCIVNNNLVVSNGNENVFPLCNTCNLIEYAQHLLFSCGIVKNIWQRVGTFCISK